MLRRIPIAAQVIALVALGIVMATAAMVAISFSGPPPREPPARLEQVVRVLIEGRTQSARREGPLNVEIIEQDDPAALAGELVEDAGLARRIAEQSGLDVTRFAAFTEDGTETARGRGYFLDDYVVGLRLEDGSWRVVRNGPDYGLQRWRRVTLQSIGVVMAVLLLLAWLAARRIVRPIEQLAREARSSEAGQPVSFAAPDGPPEITAAANALRDLHERNRKHAESRMALLAAIAHDIGTPLARIAFRIEGLSDEQREAAMRDIITIRELLADSRTLAAIWAGPKEDVDLAAICRDIAGREAETGHAVTCDADNPIALQGNQLTLQRMVQNLVDNALRYGESAAISLYREAGHAVLQVADRGPGFPEDVPPEALLQPFVRGEASRNSQTGGSGLGLAIVGQAVAQHGGAIELGRSKDGGGLVTITMPLEQD